MVVVVMVVVVVVVVRVVVVVVIMVMVMVPVVVEVVIDVVIMVEWACNLDHQNFGGVGGTVASKSYWRSAGTLLSRVPAPLPVPGLT
ncbi:hypothetical protein PoB_007561300 [Plakobranchus ocellatus]|uniref:Secreted protein n=1 Tax=Plakobranchus ocellatus TaxID=259542 RepID=A0AAV4DXM3_9GAST|nr:hypothetical protein PoB_007561300 [Plakobranchus ocellatus]